MCKIFADDTSFSSNVLDVSKSVIELNANLQKINQWACLWKIHFNSDPNKQENFSEVYFT